MSIQPLEQAIGAARSVLAGVTADQMHAPTPCASWDVAELVNHMVGGLHFFTAGIKGAPPEGDSPDFAAGDFRAAFDEAAAGCVAGFSEEGAMERTVTLPFGEFPAAGFMGLVVTDVFTHAWDLAKATGQNTDLGPDLAGAVLAQAQQNIQENFRGPEGAPFGPEAAAPEGASNADRMAAFLGRTV